MATGATVASERDATSSRALRLDFVTVNGDSQELDLASPGSFHQRRITDELLLAFRSSIGFKPGELMTIGMNEKRAAWSYRVSDRVMRPG
jgi:hypothetical protein